MNKFLEKKYKLQTNGTWLSFIKTIQNGFQYQNRQKVNPFRYEYHFTTVGIWYFLSKLLQERPCNTKSSPVTFKNQGQCLFCFDVNLVYNCVQRFWLKKKCYFRKLLINNCFPRMQEALQRGYKSEFKSYLYCPL